jgi:hypothetical protein
MLFEVQFYQVIIRYLIYEDKQRRIYELLNLILILIQVLNSL